MKYLLGTLFAALLAAPLAFTSMADQGTTNDGAIAHCGSCDKKKCKEGCDCKKCKKKDGADKGEEARSLILPAQSIIC